MTEHKIKQNAGSEHRLRLIAHMAHRPKNVYSRGELTNACLLQSEAAERTVDGQMCNLHRKLNKAGANHIISVACGVGYKVL
ncbi:winged helix-turn-helix domain-containing protein [Ochrobactrum sp. S46]|nr:winged helix-turn-helix domain-containing protein [Ochrobactrum sp. S45]MBK0046390.1 winged helix-turn-helix domain-containing protein [Ochrobactrum sp. S46]